jgi:hypothetical protein
MVYAKITSVKEEFCRVTAILYLEIIVKQFECGSSVVLKSELEVTGALPSGFGTTGCESQHSVVLELAFDQKSLEVAPLVD